MEQQYYTPNVEDIRVGYECFWVKDPIKDLTDDNLIPIIFTPKKLSSALFPPFNWEREDTDNLRPNLTSYKVSYLTKEQIEAEGWKITSDINTHTTFEKIDGFLDEEEDSTGWYYELILFNKRIYLYRYQINYGKPDKPYPGQGDGNIIYSGQCPSINEFRTIMKLLNINNESNN